MDKYIKFTPVLILNIGTGNVTGIKLYPAHVEPTGRNETLIVPDSVEIYTVDGKYFRFSGEQATEAWKLFDGMALPTMNFKES